MPDDSPIVVREYADIERADALTDVERQRVATILTEQSWDHVARIASWVLDDGEKDIATVESSDHLAVGTVEDYSPKAYRLVQRHRDGSPSAFLPKSATVVFQRGAGVESVDTPQTGLAAFAGESDA